MEAGKQKAEEAKQSVSGVVERGKEKASELKEGLSEKMQQGKETAEGAKEKVSEEARESQRSAKETKEGLAGNVQRGKEASEETAAELSEEAQRGKENSERAVQDAKGKGEEVSSSYDLGRFARDPFRSTKEALESATETTREKVRSIFGAGGANAAPKSTSSLSERIEETADQAAEQEAKGMLPLAFLCLAQR